MNIEDINKKEQKKVEKKALHILMNELYLGSLPIGYDSIQIKLNSDGKYEASIIPDSKSWIEYAKYNEFLSRMRTIGEQTTNLLDTHEWNQQILRSFWDRVNSCVRMALHEYEAKIDNDRDIKDCIVRAYYKIIGERRELRRREQEPRENNTRALEFGNFPEIRVSGNMRNLNYSEIGNITVQQTERGGE